MNRPAYMVACQENIDSIISEIPTNDEIAYAMILMTAALMDLKPDDPKVAKIILDDCKAYTARAN